MSMVPEIALVSCRNLPEPDPDAGPLLEALARAGLPSSVWAWDDPSLPWRKPKLLVLRSTWNYYRHLDQFIGWAEAVSGGGGLWNPLEVVRWNVHKQYLAELAGQGVPTVPTQFVSRGSCEVSLASILDERGWGRAVVKPEVSAGSSHTYIVERRGVDETWFQHLLEARDMMVQPYLSSVEDYGERAIVWIDGEITHAVRKSPRFHGEDESVGGALEATRDEQNLALFALGCVHRELLYARVDLARGDDGRPLVMELELVEPSLFLVQKPRALDRLVRAIGSRLRRAARA